MQRNPHYPQVYAPLRKHVRRPGMSVAVLGVGGLGHLAVQFAVRGVDSLLRESGTDSLAFCCDTPCLLNDQRQPSRRPQCGMPCRVHTAGHTSMACVSLTDAHVTSQLNTTAHAPYAGCHGC
jgi:hypothetical protein